MTIPQMTIEQAQKEKAVLERAIYDLLRTYQERTGAFVTDIDVRRAGMQLFGERTSSILAEVCVEVLRPCIQIDRWDEDEPVWMLLVPQDCPRPERKARA